MIYVYVYKFIILQSSYLSLVKSSIVENGIRKMKPLGNKR